MVAEDDGETGISILGAAGLGAKGAALEVPGGLSAEGVIRGPGGLIGAGGNVEEEADIGEGGILPVGAGGGPPAEGIEAEEVPPTAIGFGGNFSGGSFIGAPGTGGTGVTLELSVEGSLTAYITGIWRD